MSEFQALIKTHLEDYVTSDTTVTVLPDTAAIPSEDNKDAFEKADKVLNGSDYVASDSDGEDRHSLRHL